MEFKKRIILGILSFLTLSNIGISEVFASEYINKDIKDVRLKYIETANARISISNGNANISSTVLGQSVVTKTTISAQLQQNVKGTWKTIGTWTGSSNSKRCVLSKTKSVSKGYSYRVVSTVKAYRVSSSESRNIVSSTVKY